MPRPLFTLTRPGGNLGYVLVVDDEEQNRMLLRDPLEARGYEVAEAVNGMQALESVATRAPDVILLDVMMPKMDGFEACRRLKKDLKTAHIPVLMVTALSERKERLAGIGAGANDFLNKPVDYHDVVLRVGNAISSKRLFDQLQVEQQKSEQLLLNILPKAIAARIKNGEVDIVDSYEEATVLFADLVGFTTLAANIGAEQVVYFLNEIFSAFDLLAERRGLEKIKTIGDAYMIVGGIPVPRPDHAEVIAELALDMRDEIKRFNEQYGTTICIRIGINTGPLVAGVIGRKKFAYDVWGDTVNVASRLETLCEPGGIHTSESTQQRLRDKFRFERKHGLQVKGRGDLTAYWLDGRL